MNFISDQSRRDFLTTFVLGSTALALPPLLSGCNDSEKYSGKGKVPFKVWEEMLQAIMTSSDYLPGRMEELIAAKDATSGSNR